MRLPVLNTYLRTEVLRAVISTLNRFGALRDEPFGINYPLGIPDLERHLRLLVQLALENIASMDGTSPADLQARICANCPHQFPSRYCPALPRGGCVPFRFASHIVHAVGVAISARADYCKELPLTTHV